MADRTILLDGWSKTFAMTGWRLGFGVFPPALVEPVTRLAINSVSCTSAFSQYAAIAALEGPWEPVEEMVAEFRRRRDIIVAGLNDIPGISCLEPQGAFYVFPDITGTGQTSAELQAGLLKDAGVAALAGTAFGPVRRGLPAVLLRELGREHPVRARGRQGPSRLERRISAQTGSPSSSSILRNSSAAAPIEMSPGCSPSPRPGGLSGLILTNGGSCGSDQTTFLRLPVTQRLILTMPFMYPWHRD